MQEITTCGWGFRISISFVPNLLNNRSFQPLETLSYVRIFVLWGKSQSYNPRQKSWHTLQFLSGDLSLCPLPPDSMLFITMKVSLLVYNIAGGEGGLPFLVMPLGIVPQIPR